MKNIFASKTFWLNLVSFAAPIFIPGAQQVLVNHPTIATGILTGLNIANRFLTNEPVTLGASTPNPSN